MIGGEVFCRLKPLFECFLFIDEREDFLDPLDSESRIKLFCLSRGDFMVLAFCFGPEASGHGLCGIERVNNFQS